MNPLAKSSVKTTAAVSAKIANMGIFCAFLVVFIHLPLRDGMANSSVNWYFSRGIGKIAVPFFFMVSGWFLAGHFGEKRWYRTAVMKRLMSLWLPMVVWCILFWLYQTMLGPICSNWVSGRSPLSGISPSLSVGTLARLLALHPFSEPYLGVLWFVRMLFVLVVLSPWLRQLATPFGIALLFVAQAVVGPELGGTPPPLQFTLLKGFFPICGAAFFVCGIYFREKETSPTVSKRVLFVCLAVSLLLLAFRGNPYASKGAMLATLIFIPLLLLSVWSLCPAKRLPGFLTRAAFPVYLMHVFVIDAFLRSFPAFFAVLTPVRYVFLGLVSFMVCVVLSLFFHTLCPRLSGVLFGGR